VGGAQRRASERLCAAAAGGGDAPHGRVDEDGAVEGVEVLAEVLKGENGLHHRLV
jgi:hypothetical protein